MGNTRISYDLAGDCRILRSVACTICAFRLFCRVLAVKRGLKALWVMTSSSMYDVWVLWEALLGRDRADAYRMNRTMDRGKPWGIPQATGATPAVFPLKEMHILQLMLKFATVAIRLCGSW